MGGFTHGVANGLSMCEESDKRSLFYTDHAGKQQYVKHPFAPDSVAMVMHGNTSLGLQLFASASTLAHELAHTIGATHEGGGLMASMPVGIAGGPWEFKEHSQEEMRQFIRQKDTLHKLECLKYTRCDMASSMDPFFTNYLPGKTWSGFDSVHKTVENYCQREGLGENCVYTYWPGQEPNAPCERWCTRDPQAGCGQYVVPDGTECDDAGQKHCLRGQ